MRPLELPAGMVLTYAIESIDPLTGARYHSIHLRVGDEVWVVVPEETEARYQTYLTGKAFQPYPELIDVARDVVAHYWPDPAADMMALAEAVA